MKKSVLVLFFLYQNISVTSSQNLVINPSFELYDTCPYSYNQINFASNWYSPALGIAEYNNQCSLNFSSVPLNYWTYQYARTGVAYATIECYATDPSSGLSIRDYLQAQLSDTLKSGEDYCVSFYVNLTNGGASFDSNSNLIAIDKIGLYFSANAIQSTNETPLPVNPQIISSVGIFLNDTVSWMEISGMYTAQGGEKYITIGNFSNDMNTDTMYLINNHSIFTKTLYNIDDISVTACNVGVDEISEDNTFKLYPNPNNGILKINLGKGYRNTEIDITDVFGKKILHEEQKNNNTITIDLRNNPSGLYFATIIADDKRQVLKLVKE